MMSSECQAAKCQRIRQLNQFLVELFIKTRRTPLKRVFSDLDATDDQTHGAQQLALFHGYYEQHQYLPLRAFDGESGFPLVRRWRSYDRGRLTRAGARSTC